MPNLNPRSIGLNILAPLLAVLVAVAITSVILAVAGDPVMKVWQTLLQTFLTTLFLMAATAFIATVANRWGRTGMYVLFAVPLVAVIVLGMLVLVLDGQAISEVVLGILGVPWIGWMGILAAATLVAGVAWMALGRRTQVR